MLFRSSHATCSTANDLNASCIITVTKSGQTARDISKYRPDCSIMGCTTSSHVYRQLNLSWGIVPFLIEEENDTIELFDDSLKLSIGLKLLTGNLLLEQNQKRIISRFNCSIIVNRITL